MTGPTRIRDAVQAAADRIAAAGSDTARLDAELLMAEAAGRDRTWVIGHGTDELIDGVAARFEALVQRREASEPIAYILGRKGFRRLELAVDQRVLIPRPETEFVVEEILHRAPAYRAGDAPVVVADIGTGSGAIALAVADELAAARIAADVWATDASPDALEVARANAARVRLPVRFRSGDLLDALPDSVQPHIVASNLPYVAPEDAGSLMPDVVEFEPHQALFGPSGDAAGLIRTLAAQAARRLSVGGAIVLEVGQGQHSEVANILQMTGFSDVSSVPDLRGIPRVVAARLAAR